MEALGAITDIQAGNEQNKIHKRNAAQYEENAIAERANASRRAITARREAKLAQSALMAAAAGGGIANTGIATLSAGIEAQGDANVANTIYEGDMRSYDNLNKAGMERYQGQQAKRAGKMKAFSRFAEAAAEGAGMAFGMPGMGKRGSLTTEFTKGAINQGFKYATMNSDPNAKLPWRAY